jgi:hypothetical protein
MMTIDLGRGRMKLVIRNYWRGNNILCSTVEYFKSGHNSIRQMKDKLQTGFEKYIIGQTLDGKGLIFDQGLFYSVVTEED